MRLPPFIMQGTLRTQIEQLAGKLQFPLKKLYLMDGSKRSGHSNAYMWVGQGQGMGGVWVCHLDSDCYVLHIS